MNNIYIDLATIFTVTHYLFCVNDLSLLRYLICSDDVESDLANTIDEKDSGGDRFRVCKDSGLMDQEKACLQS